VAQEALAVLGDPVVRRFFNIIVKRKIVSFRELLEEPEIKSLEKVAVHEQLDKLKGVDLIDEKKATFDEFSAYYATSTGLLADRQLRRTEDKSFRLISPDKSRWWPFSS